MILLWRCVHQFWKNLKISAKDIKNLNDIIKFNVTKTLENTNRCNTNHRGNDLVQNKFQRRRHLGDVSVNFGKIL